MNRRKTKKKKEKTTCFAESFFFFFFVTKFVHPLRCTAGGTCKAVVQLLERITKHVTAGAYCGRCVGGGIGGKRHETDVKSSNKINE